MSNEKKKSLRQIFKEIHCIHSTCLVFRPVIMKLGQSVGLTNSLDMIENGSWRVKNCMSPGQILEKPCVRLGDHFFGPILMKLGQDVCLKIISKEFENTFCWIKTNSIGQILEKPCVRSGGYIFGPIFMKLDENVCLYEFYNGSSPVRNYVTRSNLKKKKKNPVHAKGLICSLILIKLGQKSQIRSKMGHVGSKTRSLSQILEKPCVPPEVIFSVRYPKNLIRIKFRALLKMGHVESKN